MPLEIPPNERICQFCQHCEIGMATPDYSSWTPGEVFDMGCRKRHWEFKPYETEIEFVRCITTARTCPDFEVNEKIVSEVSKPSPE